MTQLPDGWKQAPLESLVDILDSQRVPVNAKDREEREGEVPYYGATGQVGWIDRPLFNEELLLLGEDGVPFLDPRRPKAYMISGPSWVNNHAHVLRAVAGHTSNRYLLHYLNWFDYHGYVTGTTRLKLNQGAMRTIQVRLPPQNEQQRIVEAIEEQFSRLDAGVESLLRAERNLAGLRASILKAAVEGSLNGSHGASESLPDGWIMASPDALAAPERNALAIGPFGSNLKVSDYATTGVPLVFVRNIRRRRFDGGDTKFVTPEKAAELSSHQVEPGDLLITKMGDPPGDAAVYSGSGPAIITADCIKLRPHPDVDVRYLDIAFNSPWARSQILAITRGVAQKKISLGRFRNEVKVPLPPLEEQMAIVADVDRSLSLVEAMEGTVAIGLARAESVRRSLLREAFAGRLHVPSRRELDSA
jgi:type I restriction enzyme, S subunit